MRIRGPRLVALIVVIAVAALSTHAEAHPSFEAPIPGASSPSGPSNPPLGAFLPPPDLNALGLSKTEKLTSELDHLQRVDAVGRVAGRPITAALAGVLPEDLRAAVASGALSLDSAGGVQVFVETDVPTVQLLGPLQGLGMQIQRVSDESHMIQGVLPISALTQATTLAGVRFVRPPDRPHLSVGSVTSEGDTILLADQLRATIGNDGTGVRVGIISDGAFDLAVAQASGDLPPSVDVTTCNVITGVPPGQPANATDSGAGSEAVAMGEIVHDLAPGAQIMIGYFGLNTTVSTSLDFEAAATCLAAHTDVIADDIYFVNNGPYNGTNAISMNSAAALASVSNPLRGYYVAVGNQALQHYQEPYVDNTPANPPASSHLHRFQATATTGDAFALGPQNGDPVFLNSGGWLSVFLQWDDPWGASTNDYDLFLFNESTSTYVASSTVRQTGSQNPAEHAFYMNTGAAGYFDIVVNKFSGANKTLEFFLFCSGCAGLPGGLWTQPLHNYNTESHSVPNNADAGGGVVSVGAIDQADPGNAHIEPFSSIGPTFDGRTKPDVTGIDGVRISGAGGFGSGVPPRFFGTSAATPHAAGIAALILSCRQNLLAGEPGDNPVADRTALRNAMLSTAVDLGVAGVDNTFGAGRLNAPLAAAAAGCVGTDSDGDGVVNASDNCPKNRNKDQLNTDAANTALNRPGADALGDACDDNISGDGYTNAQHIALGKNPATFCKIMRADVDGDGQVSILDLAKVAVYFTQTVPPAPERYKQDADNQISILDLTKMAQVFTQHVTACP
jgi:Subtilase family